jgi:transposase
MTGVTEEEYLEKIDSLTETVTHLQERLRWFEKQIFGQKADRLPPTPHPSLISLFGDAEEPPVEAQADTAPKTTTVTYERTAPKGHGRNSWPDDLPRVEEIQEPCDEEKICACGKNKMRVDEDKTELLEQIPQQLYVKVIVRPKYACPLHPENGVSQAKARPRFIPKGNVGEALVTHIIMQKYVNHMPLNRQEKDYKRLGVHIPVSTMLGWIEQGAKHLAPIVESMHKDIIAGDIAYSDDTCIPVLREDKKNAAHRGFMWLYSNGEDAVVFDYRSGRGSKGPSTFLKDFKGYLHSDIFAGYKELHRTGVTPVYCWAHARRKFVAALGTPTHNGDERARRAIQIIGRLFLVERYARHKHLSAFEVQVLRTRLSKEISNRLESYCKKIELKVLPKSLLGKAMAYLRRNRNEFLTYIDDGRLSIDNNFSERQIRQVVIGRKNYMFCGSEDGADRAAIFYSIAGTCQLLGIDPWKYLVHVFRIFAEVPDSLPATLTPKALRALFV